MAEVRIKAKGDDGHTKTSCCRDESFADAAGDGARPAAAVEHAEGLDHARDRPEKTQQRRNASEHERLVVQYADSVINPDKAVAIGEIDAVIAPEATRSVIVDSLAALADKRDARHGPAKKHDNIPL